MTDPTATPPDADEVPLAQVRRRARWRFSLVWVIPAIALMIGASLVFKSYWEIGPTITIHFATAEGLEAGKTKIRYKSVDIGDVRTIALDPDRKGVVVTAQMTRASSALLVDDTRFWVVRPRISGLQISGLATLLSGSYIAMDGGQSEQTRHDFEGLEIAPNVTSDERGREFILKATELGPVDVGSLIYYRWVQVGEVVAMSLDADGGGVTLRIFVHAPYDKLVRENTRFWQSNGLNVKMNGAGLRLEAQPLISVLLGGIAFQAPSGAVPAQPAAAQQAFTLFDDEDQAMTPHDREAVAAVAYFKESVRGLSAGAPVDFQGIVIGEVKSVDLQFDPQTHHYRFPVDLTLYADRLHPRPPKDAKQPVLQAQAAHDLFIDLIKRGLRAQLRSGNLLTGQRYVALDFSPDAGPFPAHSVMRSGKSIPELPTVPGSLEDLQLTLADIAKKIDKIPFAELSGQLRQTLRSLQTTLDSAEPLIKHVDSDIVPELKTTMASTRKAMDSAEKTLAGDSPTRQDLHAALLELTRAARALRGLTDYLERQPQSLIYGKPADPAQETK